jgi:dipeptidyl aminopeptidase/acylaminoacyl peptidase
MILRWLMTTLLSLGVAPGLAARLPITHEKLWLMKRVGAPAVSPDGRWVVYPVLEPAYEPGKEVSDLWIVATDGSSPPRRLTHTRAPEDDATWSADSHRLAFTTQREGDEAPQVYILDLVAGGEARKLTNLSTGARHPQWRPDGRAILFESSVYPHALDDEANRKIAQERKNRKSNLRIYEHFPIRFWNNWLDDRQPTVLVQSLEEDSTAQDILSPTQLAHAEGFSGVPGVADVSLSPIWSRDGREIVFTATTERWNAAFAHVGYHLYRMPAAGGREPAFVTPAAGGYEEARFSADGRSLLFKYAVQDGEIYHLARLQRVAWPAGGTAIPLTPDFDREVSGYALTADGRTLYLRVPESGHENLYKVAASAGTPSPVITLSEGGYVHLVSAAASAQPVLIASYGSSVSPPEVVRIDLRARGHVNLTHVDTAAAAAIDWRPPEHFWFTSSRGRRIHNMLVLPPAFDPHKKYPLFVFIHGGAAVFNDDQLGLRWNYHLLSAPGYVVLMTDYTGSTGFGEQFAQAIKLDPLRTPGEEINQAVDEALQRYAYIDGERMCAGGASYGGHLANWLEATTTRFKCLISHAGEVDLRTQWGESDYIYDRELNNGGPAWAGGGAWLEQSPITYAASWKTPMLLSIGERDFRVPIGNTLQNWATLQRMHVPGRLLVWPDAWHWITKPEDSRRFYEEVQAWLAAYLQAGPARP